MEYREKRSIYLQIADYMCENILGGQWRESDRIPSIREMAMESEVNPNTVARSYSFLQEKGIIQNKRGIGYFISEDAEAQTRSMIKEEFVKEELPYVFRRMDLLGISVGDLQGYYTLSKEQRV